MTEILARCTYCNSEMPFLWDDETVPPSIDEEFKDTGLGCVRCGHSTYRRFE